MTSVELNLPAAFWELMLPSRFKAYYGGRGGAKSHSFAEALVIQGAQKPLRILCCREIQRSIRQSVKQLLEEKISESGLNSFYDVQSDVIKGANGTEFFFHGLRTNPQSIRSIEGIDRAWVEEANYVSQSSLDMLIPTVRKDNSEIWFSWNPFKGSDPVHNLFCGEGHPPPGTISRQVNFWDNPWFPDVLTEKLEWDRKTDLDKYLHVWEGHLLTMSQARVFKRWEVKDLDHLIPEGARPYLGTDFGHSEVSPTCLIECYLIPPRTLYFSREAWDYKTEIIEIPALFAGSDTRVPPRWENRKGYPGLESARRHYPIVADSSRPDTISHLRNCGFNIRGARKGPRSIEEGVEWIKTHEVVIHPSCENLRYEFANYSYKVDKLTEEVLPEFEDKNNHGIDSARYALEATRRSTGTEIALTVPRGLSAIGWG